MIFAIPFVLLYAALLISGIAVGIAALFATGAAMACGASAVWLFGSTWVPRYKRARYFLAIAVAAALLTVVCFYLAAQETLLWWNGSLEYAGWLALGLSVLTIAHAIAVGILSMLSAGFKVVEFLALRPIRSS